MEINKQIISIFSSFIRDLSKTFPEIKNCLYRNYEAELTPEFSNINQFSKIKTFLNKIKENEKLIKDKDESFFEKDFELLEEISFKRLWEKNISDKTKNIIWKYLQSFSIININLNSSDELKNLLDSIKDTKEISKEEIKEEIKDKQTAKDLKDLKKLTEDINSSQNISNSNSEEEDLEDMLGGMMDSNIGKIAKEVAENMDIESILGNVDETSNPMELMTKLMNPEKMGSIFQNIDQIMNQKMKDGDIDSESLKKEAEGMYGNMSHNPMFASMMQQMNNKELTEEEKKEKLRQKIREKEENKKKEKEKLRKKIIKENKINESTKEEKKEKLRQIIREKEKNRKKI